MKVAGVAAERGHAVTLFEGSGELGGHLNLIRRMPTRDGWQRAIDNLERPLEREGVTVRLGVDANAEALSGDAFDAVVIAAGATWSASGFSVFRPDRETMPGHDAGGVLGLDEAARRAIDDPRSLGARVVSVDETGAYLPGGLAELLADAGVAVEVMTPAMMVGEQLAVTSELPFVYPRLHAKGVRLTTQTLPERYDGDRLEIQQLWSGEREVREADTVVFSTLRTANDELYHRLRVERADVRRVGDALAPRSVAAVIYEGEELGRAL
jgi:hypothetical protein